MTRIKVRTIAAIIVGAAAVAFAVATESMAASGKGTASLWGSGTFKATIDGTVTVKGLARSRISVTGLRFWSETEGTLIYTGKGTISGLVGPPIAGTYYAVHLQGIVTSLTVSGPAKVTLSGTGNYKKSATTGTWTPSGATINLGG